MAKSIRSKRKKKFRAIKREVIYKPVIDARLEKCLSRLHVGSKVIEAPILPEEPKRFSFVPFFTTNELTSTKREYKKPEPMNIEKEDISEDASMPIRNAQLYKKRIIRKKKHIVTKSQRRRLFHRNS